MKERRKQTHGDHSNIKWFEISKLPFENFDYVTSVNDRIRTFLFDIKTNQVSTTTRQHCKQTFHQTLSVFSLLESIHI